jgi:hypothetical protein
MTWRLHHRASYGKSAGTLDYAWMSGESAVPSLLHSLTIEIAQQCSERRVSAACLVAHEGRAMLARTRSLGPDASGRAVVGVEVSELDPPVTTTGAWCGIVAAALAAAPDASLLAAVPDDRVEPADRTNLARAILGFSVGGPAVEAAALLRALPARFTAVLRFGLSHDGRTSVDAPGEVLLLDAVPSPLAGDDMALVDACLALDGIDLETLGAMPPDVARTAIRWFRGDAHAAIDDRAIDWIVSRSMRYAPHDVLASLRSSLTPPLFERAVDMVAARLPQIARDAIDATRSGRRASIAGLEILAAHGLLATDLLVPAAGWIKETANSPALDEVLRRRLTDSGVDAEHTAFLMDRPPGRGGIVPDEFLATSIDVALGLGLPAPLGRVRALIDEPLSAAELEAWARVMRSFGGAAADLLDACVGHLPPLDRVDSADLAGVLRVRERLAPGRGALDVLAKLSQDRERDLRVLIADDTLGSIFSAADLDLLRARAGLIPPLCIDHQAAASPLLARGVVRPFDVVPSGLDAAEALSLRFEQVAAICAPIRAVASIPDLEECPGTWRDFLVRMLTPARAAEWLRACGPARHSEAVELLARLLPQVRPLVPLLRDGGEVTTLTTDQVAWLPVLIAGAPSDARLRLLTVLTASRALNGREVECEQALDSLLSEASEATRDFVAFALTAAGGPPSLDDVAPDIVAALACQVPPAAFVEAWMRSGVLWLDRAPSFIDDVVAAIRRAGAVCPAGGFSIAQRRRHGALAHALGAVEGWEALALDAGTRERAVRQLATRLGLEIAVTGSQFPRGM